MQIHIAGKIGIARILLCLLLSCAVHNVAGRDHLSILINDNDIDRVSVNSQLALYVDRDGRATAETVLQADSNGEFVSELDALTMSRFRQQIFWAKLKIRAGQNIAHNLDGWILELPSPGLRGVALFVKSDQNELVQLAPELGRHWIFPLQLDTQRVTELYLRVPFNGMFNVPVNVWNAETYLLYKRQTLPAWGLFFGGMLILVFYNLALSASLSERVYFYLAAFLFSSLLSSAFNEGFMNPYPAIESWLTHFELSAYLQCISLMCAVAFTRAYLNTGQEYPVIDRWLKGAMIITTLLGLSVALELTDQGNFLLLFLLCSTVFFIPSVFACLNASQKAARYFLAGWSLFLLGYLLFQLGVAGVVPQNDITLHLKELALCLLGVTLSLGIAAQIQQERQDKRTGVMLQNETMLELKYAEEQLQKKVLRDTLQDFSDLATFTRAATDLVYRDGHSDGDSSGKTLVLVVVELHHLAQVESRLGHSARNELLTRATRRLSVVLRSIVGVVPLREFKKQYVPMAVLETGRYAFMLRSLDECAVNLALEEVEQAMQRPFFYQGVSLLPGVSFGVAMHQGAGSFQDLMRQCTDALAADKARNLEKGYQLESENRFSQRNIGLVNELRASIQEDRIDLYFQPVYDLRGDQVCSIEVLTRWSSSSEHQVSPTEIFHLAEVGGFISELTLKVIDKAIHHFLIAVDPVQNNLKLSINLSPKCLREDGFIDDVGYLLEKNNIPARVLSFEIKEAAIIEDPHITREILDRIRAKGIGLTIDEFGAAYSNPSYMSNLPVTEVKLDQRIIANLSNAYDRDAIRDVVQLCRARDIKLVVQGVENETAFEELETLGCNFAQGHYLAEPVRAADFRLHRQRNRKPVQQRIA